jgi:hypothetical protein
VYVQPFFLKKTASDLPQALLDDRKGRKKESNNRLRHQNFRSSGYSKMLLENNGPGYI